MKSRAARFLFFALLSVLIFGLPAAYADEQYQAEIAPEYMRQDIDGNTRVTAAGINGEVFFAPVNTADHPYAEAAFLERIGSVFFSAARLEEEGDGLKADGMLYGVGVNLTKPGFPLALRATYGTTSEDITEPVTGDFKTSFYNLSIGDYLTRTLLAGVEYSYGKTEFSAAGFTGSSTKRNNLGLFARYAHELQDGRELSFTGSLETRKRDDGTETLTNTDVKLAVDYFFNRSLSAGVGVENNSGKYEFEEGTTYSANIYAFITPMYSIKVSYERFLNSNPDESSDRTIDVILAARF